MSITLKYVVMGIAAMLVLGFIWARTRTRSDRRRSAIRPAGKGLSGELAAAVEDVASEFLDVDRRRDRPTTTRDRHAKRPGKY